MPDTDSHSFSLISEPGIETIYTPTEQDTDDYDFVFEDGRSECVQQDNGSSCCTSLAPSMLDYEHSNGRRYHAYLSGRYPLPNDKGERCRELAEHILMQHLLDGELFLSDIGDKPKKIIDIGTGTGAWAIDVADLYPGASVIGTDLSPTQPKSMPLNACMFVEDCEDPYWANGYDFDLVHFRGMAGFLLDLDAMVANAYEQLLLHIFNSRRSACASPIMPSAVESPADAILNHSATSYNFRFSPFLRQTYQVGLSPDRPVCKAFQSGHCPNGTRCPERHVSDSKTSQPTGGLNSLVCKHWLRGLCKKGEHCEFLHEYNLRKMPECNFFMRNGYCSNGDECLYLHIDPQSRLPPCPHYDMGFCPLGPNCSKKHVRRKLCVFYLAGFCPDGPDCKEGAHPKWSKDLEKPTLKSEEKKDEEMRVEFSQDDMDRQRDQQRDRDRDDGGRHRGGHGGHGGHGGRGKWRGRGRYRARGH
ncbi:unnamed protein product [Fusarium graminearum]|nr:unnamed protein product [Fusarium graminearum]